MDTTTAIVIIIVVLVLLFFGYTVISDRPKITGGAVGSNSYAGQQYGGGCAR